MNICMILCNVNISGECTQTLVKVRIIVERGPVVLNTLKENYIIRE